MIKDRNPITGRIIGNIESPDAVRDKKRGSKRQWHLEKKARLERKLQNKTFPTRLPSYILLMEERGKKVLWIPISTLARNANIRISEYLAQSNSNIQAEVIQNGNCTKTEEIDCKR